MWCKKDGFTVFFLKKCGFKKFVKNNFNKDVLSEPDEAFIVLKPGKLTEIFILEKKHQNCAGSVEQKLWAAFAIRHEYMHCFGTHFNVHYGFCLSTWYKTQFEKSAKYAVLKKHFAQEKIPYFFGECPNYYRDMLSWIGI